MAHELTTDEFEIARPLFADLGALQLSAAAVLDGASDGRLVVDDPQRPRSALLTSPEGAFLAGNPDNEDFGAALHRFVWDELFGRSGWEIMFVTVDDPGWEDRLMEIAAPRDVLRVERRHYMCHTPQLDWRTRVPDGFAVRRVDSDLLNEEDLTVPDHLRGWILNNWGTRERFLERGFGFATVHERAVVSWSLADCRSGDACEIGIQTHCAFRRRGLATVTVAAAVEHALTGDFRSVGWHSNEDNLGSIGTAEMVGFYLERRYASLYFHATEAEELAERC